MTEIFVTLRIFFFGLLVFVPDHPRDGETAVLLLDARNPPHATDGCPIHSHTPMLFFKAQPCPDECRPGYGLCGCELRREQICLGGQVVLASTAALEALPSEPKGLPEMGEIKGQLSRVRRDCLAAGDLCPQNAPDPQEQVCELIAARVGLTLPVGAVTPCNDLGEFPFLPLTHRRPLLPLRASRQRLADVLKAEVTRSIEAFPFKLTLVGFERTGRYELELPRPARDTCGSREKPCRYDLVIANVPVPHAGPAYGRCHSGTAVARDFELYHDLVERPLRLHYRPVPNRLGEPARPWLPPPGKGDHQQGHGSTEISAEECRSSEVLNVFLHSILRTALTRDVCPPASMSSGK